MHNQVCHHLRVLILALSAIAWMSPLNSWGAESGSKAHAKLVWKGSPGLCLSCHKEEAREVYASTHYQWQGEALYRTGGPLMQGKISNAVNSYCINILGNWADCGSCHVGLGAQPVTNTATTDAQLNNIDCLICHQKDYKRIQVNGAFVPDTANMSITMNQAVRTVHRPERSNCLACHAKAGGGGRGQARRPGAGHGQYQRRAV